MEDLQSDANLDFQLFGDRKKLERHALTQIRKQSLDPYNRLHSIAEDSAFVKTVRNKYRSYPILANLRCGAWYCDPILGNGETAHFKSTDGHYNGWSFNLRRPNLHVLPLIRDAHGLSLVDATRSGKRMPDSLSKTVPIWCSVINRAVKLRNITSADDWDVQLYTPPQCVSKQEHSQIEEKIDAWAESLAKSSYELPGLDKPLRPIWITPATTTFPSFDEDTPFFPIMCISASKLVDDGSSRRQDGYSYVQGAGDDHEYWSAGLNPERFWEHKDVLLTASESDFMNVLLCLVNDSKAATPASSAEWIKSPAPVARVGGLLSICALADIPDWVVNQHQHEQSATSFPCIILRMGSKPPQASLSENLASANAPAVLELFVPGDKKGSERFLKACLPQCLEFIKRNFQEGRCVCVACETGKDLSVGIALVAMQVFFDDDGSLDLSRHGRKYVRVNKDTIRTRLHWIIASRPEANPSRATLKRVNEFFMSSSYHQASF